MWRFVAAAMIIEMLKLYEIQIGILPKAAVHQKVCESVITVLIGSNWWVNDINSTEFPHYTA